MATTIRGWTTLAEHPLVLVREYSFGAGLTNAMAVGLPDGKLMLVSPPANVPDTELRELGAAGEVIAVVANNGMHHLGLAGARSAFPGATTYATPVAASRIRKKNGEAGELEPIAALQPQLGDAVRVLVVEGSKVGDVIVSVRTDRGPLLYASDFIANIPQLPSNPLIRLAFRLTKSAPGLRIFGMFFTFYVNDRKAACDCLIREIDAHGHAMLVPAHGAVINRADLAATLVSMLRAAR